jgi:hypothetical protein
MRGRGRGLVTGGAPPTGVLRRVSCCCEPGLRAVGVLLQVVVGAGAGRPHPCAPWPWRRRPVGFACSRSAPQTMSHVRVLQECVCASNPAGRTPARPGGELAERLPERRRRAARPPRLWSFRRALGGRRKLRRLEGETGR